MSVLNKFKLNEGQQIADLFFALNMPNKFVILVSEYAHGNIETKFYVVDKINLCIHFIKNRYSKFNKEKSDYKHIEEEYIEEKKYFYLTSQYGPDDNNNIFSTKIQIHGINESQYYKIQKKVKKIFGNKLFGFYDHDSYDG